MGTSSGASLVGILPLLAAGFIFNSIFYRTRFRLARADGQRLFFSCVIAGFSIGCIAFAIAASLRRHLPSEGRFRELMDWFHQAIPVPYSMTFLGAIMLAAFFGHAANGYLWWRKRLKAPADSRRVSVWTYWREMSEHVTALDELVRRAVSDDSLVMICLKSRKVYCGLISGIRGVHESAMVHIQLIPAFSITRDKDSLKFLPETRTEYRAFSLKRAFDRKASLDSEIRDIARLVRVLRAVRSMSEASPDEPTIAGVKNYGRQLIRERTDLVENLARYGALQSFDATEWLKVIPASEIESASLYKDGDFDRWFSTPSVQVS
ncbi:DUF6338 family protein [Luteibacter sp. 22Crub2.1]|uniref:DUF6338 family protein n=1 Tax=Luteibacter sp. 22Crub2.1 TaxID=1283288 RepID=UPI001116091C|nr:DUF6338 family protein [Luteibacter sp. 22Crub2.1]